ncbi:LptF/LptG family permease [Solitalea canadensis]|uniref:Putative permease n=1 Tax=Solitalea canadensis (strain ATCC 29591 / DSM 3403 / JCM 21819 / LMG 8368 / NBRC 15130 / NCIMB 12057 / USAM 9D) TaxID=929556 RepID=H8KUF1_SOLCM|nr:LptF/LptG family permease [Solitalea canadensis]AFD07316.1 putative permease [Solitalea canadensis DSM 3403]
MKSIINKFKKLLNITKLDEHIIKKFLGTFFFGLAIFIIIIVIFDISEKLDDFLKGSATFKQIVLDYYVNFVLFYVSVLSPVVIFLAVIFFTAKMANNTEIVPILSSGVSYFRFLYPYFITAAFLAVVSFIANAYIIPPSTRTKLDFEHTYIHTKYEYKGQNRHFKLDEHSYAYIQSYNIKDNSGYKFTLEKFKGDTLYYKLVANRIAWDTTKKEWKIENYSIRHNNGLKERMEGGDKLFMKLNLSTRDFEKQDDTRGSMTLPQLNRQIELEELRGTGNVSKYEMDRWRILTTPVSIFILVVMAVTLSSKKVRGGVGLPLGIGIGCSFAYIILMQFAEIFSTKGDLPTYIAAWVPHIIFGSLAIYLYKIAPK